MTPIDYLFLVLGGLTLLATGYWAGVADGRRKRGKAMAHECAWCRRNIGTVPISHGMCPECQEKFSETVNQ